jgi:hypothetical protein
MVCAIRQKNQTKNFNQQSKEKRIMNTHEIHGEAELKEPRADPLVYELPQFLFKYPGIADVGTSKIMGQRTVHLAGFLTTLPHRTLSQWCKENSIRVISDPNNNPLYFTEDVVNAVSKWKGLRFLDDMVSSYCSILPVTGSKGIRYRSVMQPAALSLYLMQHGIFRPSDDILTQATHQSINH